MNLTDKEKQIVALCADGKNVKAIASELHVSPETIKAQKRIISLKQAVIEIGLICSVQAKEINRLSNLLYQIEHISNCDMAGVLAKKRGEA